MRITVLGGDGRSVKLIDLLSMDGHEVKVYGFNEDKLKEVNLIENLEEAIKGSKLIVGPIPCTREDKYLNTPSFSEKVPMEDVFKAMEKNQIFIGGGIPAHIRDQGKERDIRVIDLMKRVEMAVLNAVPTAEGAIELALKETDITLYKSNSLVLGYGKVGKILADRLHRMGATTYVEARNCGDLAWIEAYGYKPVNLKELDDYLPKMDLVFNTIPDLILDEERLMKLKKDCLVIDLASKPGGVDFEKAKDLGIEVVWALALPGKAAPKTAASIIKSTIYNIIDELEVF